MSNLRQKISNLLKGISQQPDNKKFPGQLRECINAYPDWTTGLMKRPGEKYQTKLINADTGNASKWFSIVRDNNEKYVGQFDSVARIFKIWDANTGDPVTVKMGPNSYITNPSYSYTTLQSARNTYSAAKADVLTKLATLQLKEKDLAVAIANESATVETLLEVNTTYATSLDQSVVSGVLYDESTGDYIIKVNGTYIGGTLSSTYALGNDRSSEYEIITSNGFKLYEVIVTTAATVSPITIVGQIVGNQLTVTSGGGSIYAGMYLTAAGVPANTKVISGGPTVFTINTSLSFSAGTVFIGYSAARTAAYDAYNTASTDYTTAVAAEATAYTAWQTQANYANAGTVTAPYYLTDGDTGTTPVTPDNLEILTLTDYTFIVNKSKTVKPLKQTFGGYITTTSGVTSLFVTSVATGSKVVPGMTIAWSSGGIDGLATISRQTAITAPSTSVGGIGTYTLINALPLAAGSVGSPVTFTANLVSPTYPTENNNLTPYWGFVVVAIVANNSKYQVIINSTKTGAANPYTVSHTTPASTSTVDTETITSALVSAINSSTAGHGVTATSCGTGILLKGTDSFNIEVKGTTAREGMYAFQDTIGDITKLPVQCANGYTLKVTNTERVEEDDYYVKFKSNSGDSIGIGTWEETVKPGSIISFDPLTMPHQLVRTFDNGKPVFIYGPITGNSLYYSSASDIVDSTNSWTDRLAGDDTTNPLPSFYGRKISGIFFYRDRLGFLSDDNAILSRSGQYFTFFGKSAATVLDSDPIDVNVASVEPTVINYVLPVSVGLVLFGQRQQFILTTDADVLSPKAAKINNLSNYECDPTLQAQSFGSSVAFVSKSNLYTRVFELLGITVDAPPVIDETSRVVPQLLPSSVDNYIVSPNLALASFGTTDSNTLYHYKYLVQASEGGGVQRVLAAWYKWNITNTLKHQWFDLNTLNFIGKSGSDIIFTTVDLAGTDTDGAMRLKSGRTVNPNLDMWVLNPYRTYDYATDTTTITASFDIDTSKTFCAVCLDEFIGDAQTSESKGRIIYPTSFVGRTFTVPGNYLGKTIVIGYTYNMLVEMPKLFYNKGESTSSISETDIDFIIHRMKVGLTMSGPLDYEIRNTGINNWANTANVTYANQYLLDTINVTEASEQVIPVYQRNKNIQLLFNSNSPLPMTIDWLTWEGKINSRSYSSG